MPINLMSMISGHGHDMGRGMQEALNGASAVAKIMSSAFTLATSFILMLGAVATIIAPNPFWFVVSIWAIVIVLRPNLEPREIRQLPWWIQLPIVLPFITYSIGVFAGFRPLDMSAQLSWLISSIGLFSLSMATILIIDVRGRMHMNRAFFSGATFLLLESAVAIQGWISWYGDLVFGTGLVPSSTVYMVYDILVTATCLALTISVYFHFRKRPYQELRAQVVAR